MAPVSLAANFRGHVESSALGPVLVEELKPRPDPWQVFDSIACLSRPIFLDSALTHPSIGRYSFITADPFAWLWSRGWQTWQNGSAASSMHSDPLSLLAEELSRYRAAPVDGLPPFQGGAAGLFGYDLCHHLEKLPRPRFDDFQVPDLAVGFYDWVISFDHASGRAWLISTGFPETDLAGRRRRAGKRMETIKRRLSNFAEAERGPLAGASSDPLPWEPALSHAVTGLPGLLSNFEREDYLKAVERIIEYLRAGDCFQVNLAQRLLYPAHMSAVELYKRLRAGNPSPFACYFDLGDFKIASASPERFLRCERGRVQTRPIKGTRPRGRTPGQDRALVEELGASVKDRAENVMIVDLLRNDLGRVCGYGSIDVPTVCGVETYPYVHHLVSEVCGRLRSGLGPIDLLRAAFPGGSVTGAPKIRAMEIIAELEPTARGPYCGSLGYVGFDGTMDTNILIRTFTVGRGWVQFPVGGGIVADSIPEREYDETWHKAAGLLQALNLDLSLTDARPA
jgi:para-aminobenzoate synthetase component 1